MKHKKQANQEIYGADEEAAAAAEAVRAIKFIETHLFEELTVARIAHECATSAFHFSRRFSRRQGESVMAYVRGRRLDFAAKRLTTEPDTVLVDIALDSRFESQAAFTRAFTRAFGTSPDKYRRSVTPRSRTRRNAMTPPLVLHESLEYVGTFQVAGLSARFDPSKYLDIPTLWKAFAVKSTFEGRLGDGETCGVFRERDASLQSFEHLAGARIVADKKPDSLEVWTLPGRHYLVFKQMLTEGELHPQVAAAQSEIWSKRLPQSGRALARAADFQIYPANFKVGVGGWLAYYIPVE